MDTSSNRFVQESTGETFITPIGVLTIVSLGIMMLLLPRRYAFIPIAIMTCFVGTGQRIIILGANFQLMRLLVLIGWARVVLHGEFIGIRWGWIDFIIILWAGVGLVAYTALWGTTAAFVWRLGNIYDLAGCYFLLRCLVRNLDDVDIAIVAYTVLSIPVMFCFLFEHATRLNMFSIFGGVPTVTEMRDGRLRCQGAYSGPIVAGCFWATLLPLIAARWFGKGSRVMVTAGVASSLIIIILCASSTPVASVGCCLLGGMAFIVRKWMRSIIIAVVILLVFLQFAMTAPIWHLLARVDFAGGSTGYYRYLVVDAAINHFSDWYLIGTKSMEGWNPLLELVGDVPNEFVAEGVRGGVFTVLLFCAVLALCFRRVGICRKLTERNPPKLAMVWAFGVALFAHCGSFLGLAYFGQITVIFFFLLAAIAQLDVLRARKTEPQGSRDCESAN